MADDAGTAERLLDEPVGVLVDCVGLQFIDLVKQLFLLSLGIILLVCVVAILIDLRPFILTQVELTHG